MNFLQTPKAAALVLLWTLCLGTALWSINKQVEYFGYKVSDESKITPYLLKSSMGIGLIAIPVIGWMADTWCGNFKVFRAGCVLMFLGSVMTSVSILVANNLSRQKALLTIQILGSISNLVCLSGITACVVTVFQFGLDQLPDASSVDIINFILNFTTTASVGVWLCDLLLEMLKYCTPWNLSEQIASLLPVLCMCIVLSSLIFLGNKWLIIEPKSPQSLKMIYRVLKFAAKHKFPLNRSALTYWEENIPSRLDLGKSRYGGPFTTDQVEEVKTFFRLLPLILIGWLLTFSYSMFGYLSVKTFTALEHHNSSTLICKDAAYSLFAYNERWCCVVTFLAYKFCIYPCIKGKLPSTLKRAGICLVSLTLLEITYSFVGYFFSLSIWPSIIHVWLSTTLECLAVITAMEFACAQSPYNMRGLFSMLIVAMTMLALILGTQVYYLMTTLCTSKHCLIILYSIGSFLSITGFLLYLVTAYRYKRRVRDEEYNPYPHIEDIYDRYLTQAQNTSPFETFDNETLASNDHS